MEEIPFYKESKDRLHEVRITGHRINFGKTESVKNEKQKKIIIMSVTSHRESLTRILGWHHMYEGYCAYTQTHSPGPVTHFMIFPILASATAALGESTIASADLKESRHPP